MTPKCLHVVLTLIDLHKILLSILICSLMTSIFRVSDGRLGWKKRSGRLPKQRPTEVESSNVGRKDCSLQTKNEGTKDRTGSSTDDTALRTVP